MARDGSEIVIYTDGGAIGNPGPGGFGVVAEIDGQEKTLARGYRATTNNRMELMGVIAGLVSTDRYASGKHTVVVSDFSVRRRRHGERLGTKMARQRLATQQQR